jgi:hypothetical protein
VSSWCGAEVKQKLFLQCYVKSVYSEICTFAFFFNLVRKLEGRGTLGRPRHKWEDNIKIDLKEIA